MEVFYINYFNKRRHHSKLRHWQRPTKLMLPPGEYETRHSLERCYVTDRTMKGSSTETLEDILPRYLAALNYACVNVC